MQRLSCVEPALNPGDCVGEGGKGEGGLVFPSGVGRVEKWCWEGPGIPLYFRRCVKSMLLEALYNLRLAPLLAHRLHSIAFPYSIYRSACVNQAASFLRRVAQGLSFSCRIFILQLRS